MALNKVLSQVEALYIGYFGRAGEPDGVNYWVERLETGYSWAQMAASFSVQPEARAQYDYLSDPENADAGAFIDAIYQNLFGRAPDEEGKAYWLEQLESRGNDPQAIGQFILDIISGSYAEGANPNDSKHVENKVAAAEYFTGVLEEAGIGGTHTENGVVVLNTNLVDLALAAVKNVTDDPSTIEAANDAIDAVVNDIAEMGLTYTLSNHEINAAGYMEGTTFTYIGSGNLGLDARISGDDGHGVQGAFLVHEWREQNYYQAADAMIDVEGAPVAVYSVAGGSKTVGATTQAFWNVDVMEITGIGGSSLSLDDFTFKLYLDTNASEDIDWGVVLTLTKFNGDEGYSSQSGWGWLSDQKYDAKDSVFDLFTDNHGLLNLVDAQSINIAWDFWNGGIQANDANVGGWNYMTDSGIFDVKLVGINSTGDTVVYNHIRINVLDPIA
ncbi:MAG TPA: DUF4214 domain-containing protein [Xanthobacteraceae bacterium]|nr:DUF4214 domain-containing protein [Xanthobacteraceae bacterium]